MGADFDDVDWRTLDPRQYDPRRIIREALLDDAPVPTVRAASAAAAVATASAFTKPQTCDHAVHGGGSAALRQRGDLSPTVSQFGRNGSERPARPRGAAASRSASALIAIAAGSSGWATTMGVPASPSARR